MNLETHFVAVVQDTEVNGQLYTFKFGFIIWAPEERNACTYMKK